jgi:hypothetical protein
MASGNTLDRTLSSLTGQTARGRARATMMLIRTRSLHTTVHGTFGCQIDKRTIKERACLLNGPACENGQVAAAIADYKRCLKKFARGVCESYATCRGHILNVTEAECATPMERRPVWNVTETACAAGSGERASATSQFAKSSSQPALPVIQHTRCLWCLASARPFLQSGWCFLLRLASAPRHCCGYQLGRQADRSPMSFITSGQCAHLAPRLSSPVSCRAGAIFPNASQYHCSGSRYSISN